MPKLPLKMRLRNKIRDWGERVVGHDSFARLIKHKDTSHEAVIAFLQKLPVENLTGVVGIWSQSRSQIRQDLFVLGCLGTKKPGYFVEFGATNGIDLSNSWLLETEFGWTGIVAEPGQRWHAALKRNRTCKIVTDCVWKTSGETLVFNETDTGELSTLDRFSNADFHAEARLDGKKYEVNTISLNDLLSQENAPEIIDYLSIDTEGSELDILSAFDFKAHRFRIITVEHNYMPIRKALFDLLSAHGYERVLQAHSDFDDWYVLPDLLPFKFDEKGELDENT